MANELPRPERSYKPTPLLCGAVALAWVLVWRIQDVFPLLGKIKFAIMAQLALVILFFIDSRAPRKVGRTASPPLAIIGVMLLLMLAGLPTNLWMGKAINFLTREYAIMLFFTISLATGLRERKDVQWFAAAHILGALLYSFDAFRRPMQAGRLAGLAYFDGNDYALLLNCTIPFLIFYLRPSFVWWKRIAALGIMAFFLLMIIKTGSRGGFLGLAAMMIFVLFMYRAIPLRLRAGAFAGGVLVLVVLAPPTYWTMIASMGHLENDYNMTEEVGRKAVWSRGMGYMWSHPLLGVGVAAFPQAEGSLSAVARRYAEIGRGIKWSVAHNSFVEVGAELGIFGLAAFVTLLFTCVILLLTVRVPRGPPHFKRVRRRGHITEDDEAMAQSIAGSFIAFMICGFFISAEYFGILYMLVAMTIGQRAILRERRAKVRRVEEAERAAEKARRPWVPQWHPASR